MATDSGQIESDTTLPSTYLIYIWIESYEIIVDRQRYTSLGEHTALRKKSSVLSKQTYYWKIFPQY